MLAAQLCNELKSFFPRNNIEYFVSYYDYYRPEAYLAVSDVFVEKVSIVNRIDPAMSVHLLTYEFSVRPSDPPFHSSCPFTRLSACFSIEKSMKA